MTLEQLRSDADTFLSAINASFDYEHGITDDEALNGVIALYLQRGMMTYGDERRIRAEIAEEERIDREQREAKAAEYRLEHPQSAEMDNLLRLSLEMNNTFMCRSIARMMGFDPWAEQEAHIASVRGWWKANGVTL